MQLNARWDLNEKEGVISVVYHNIKRGIVFDCGVVPLHTPIEFLMEFILSEGEPGDFVYRDGETLFQVQKEASA